MAEMSLKRVQQVEENLQIIASLRPEIMGNFKNLKETVMKDGALTKREKMFVLLGIVISKQCSDCIVVNMREAIELGITLEELVEVCGVSAAMGGGPGIAYSCQAVEAYQQLKKEMEK